MIQGLGHIALAVTNLEMVLGRLCDALGVEKPQVKDMPERQIKVALVEIGNLQLEILEDYSKDGFIARHTAAHGNSIHHFCLLTDDIEKDLAELDQKGVPLVDRQPRTGVRGKRIAFLSEELLNGIPIELSEP